MRVTPRAAPALELPLSSSPLLQLRIAPKNPAQSVRAQAAQPNRPVLRPRALLVQHVHQTPLALQTLRLLRLQVVARKVDHRSRASRNSRFMNHSISSSFSEPGAPVPFASNL